MFTLIKVNGVYNYRSFTYFRCHEFYSSLNVDELNGRTWNHDKNTSGGRTGTPKERGFLALISD